MTVYRYIILLTVGASIVAVAFFQFTALSSTEPVRRASVTYRERPLGVAIDSVPVSAEGHVTTLPDFDITLNSELDATVVRVAVAEHTVVRRGDLLVELRSPELEAVHAELTSRANEAVAELKIAEQDLRAHKDLAEHGFISPQGLLRYKLAWERELARKHASDAVVRRNFAQLAKLRILSPIDGVAIARYVQAGEVVRQEARLIRVSDLTKMRIDVEVDEFDVGRIKPGLVAEVSAESDPDRIWRGQVEQVGAALVARRIRPQDPARPVDTMVLPVRIVLIEPATLKLGQRVNVSITSSVASR